MHRGRPERGAGTVSVTTGQTFTVTDDDGLELEIGALLVIDQPGPTAPVTQTFTYPGPNGNLPFDLVYGECCGAPAVLQIVLPLVTPTATPELTSPALIGSALAVVLSMFAIGIAGSTFLGWK